MKKTADIRERMCRYLRDKGMRRTPERLAVIDAIAARTGAFTAEELHAGISGTSFPVSLATVYNSVSMLVTAGILRCMQLPGQSSRLYEAVADSTSQAYFICRVCGSSRKYRGAGLASVIKRHDFGELSPEYFILNIYGLCRKCAGKTGKKAETKKLEI